MKKVLTAFVTVAVSYCAVSGQAARPKSHVDGKPGDLTMNMNGDAAGPLAITGGKLLTVTHGVIENGVIVLSGGKIAAVGGPGTAIPAGAQVVDAKGMTVYPGLVDAETNLGLIEVEADQASNDRTEPSAVMMPKTL